MFKLRAVIHCPGFLHGTSCTCLAAVSLAIYQCDGAGLASAALGIGLIAFINQRLIETADTSLLVLPEFLGLLLLLMAVTLGSQWSPLWGITSFTDCVVNLSSGFWIPTSSALNNSVAPRCWRD